MCRFKRYSAFKFFTVSLCDRGIPLGTTNWFSWFGQITALFIPCPYAVQADLVGSFSYRDQ